MMKNKASWFVAGLSAGAFAFVLAQRYSKTRQQILAWQQRRRPALEVLACPCCHGTLGLARLSQGEEYHCQTCNRDYPVVNGIGHFIEPAGLTGLNKSFAGMYDWLSGGYRAFSKVAFAYIGMKEEEGRREVTDRLEPGGGCVLEVSIGPGVNLPYLIDRPDVGELYGLDISLGQLSRCRTYVAQRGWNVQLDLGNAEQLPYQDNTFGGVFHVGGINFFNDKRKAIEEMIRVAKPGARILIADESEKGAQGYERFIPGFKSSFGAKRDVIRPPIDLVPAEMLAARVFDIWKGWLYCIEFRKPG